MSNFWQNHESNVLESNEQFWSNKVRTQKLLPDLDTNGKKKLESLGVVFGDLYDEQGCKLYKNNTLPEGWQYHVTNNRDPRHMTLRDASNNDVASLFIKLGGYDCCCYINVL